ncbi:MAG: DUF1223 domain-containing protein [Acidiferrobacterales bacterium]|nr:DUF1223 domain-containing protein [Acidiferrobacterales bacterium]
MSVNLQLFNSNSKVVCFSTAPRTHRLFKVALLLVSSVIFSTSIFSTSRANESYSSGTEQVALLELYTSEGCSSCPPADRWLSNLKTKTGLWESFIPIALHVDYWDYIGWKDPYADRAHSQRQRRYASEAGERTVYTPGVRLNGEEWRAWRYGNSITDDEQVTAGELELNIHDNQKFTAHYSSEFRGDWQLNVAVLGMGLQQEVTRGENQGRTLNHDFVVLGMSTIASSEAGKWQGNIPSIKAKAESYAVVAWVSEGGRLAPIQATGGPLTSFQP